MKFRADLETVIVDGFAGILKQDPEELMAHDSKRDTFIAALIKVPETDYGSADLEVPLLSGNLDKIEPDSDYLSDIVKGNEEKDIEEKLREEEEDKISLMLLKTDFGDSSETMASLEKASGQNESNKALS